MYNTSRNVLKARCDSMGIFLRFIFWVYAAYVVVMAGVGLWMMMQPESDFLIHILDTGNGLAGFGFYKGNMEVDFARNMLNDYAVEHSKWAYLIGYIGGLVERGIYLAILWHITAVFKKIDKDDGPFIERSCKAIFRVGVLIIISGFINSRLTGTVLAVMKYSSGGSGNASYWWHSIIIGGIVICLSYVFEYGTSLQTESDETL